MELDGQPRQRIWALRKAAWAIEDLEQDVGLIYRQMGVKGLQTLPNIGPSLACVIEPWITQDGFEDRVGDGVRRRSGGR
jgi:DNA polymerase/3'-5' exonuclease PolX